MPLPMASRSPFEGFPLTLYGRVSKDQRGGRSVSQQLRRGRRWSAEHGCVVVGEFSDNDKSASSYATKQREDWPKVEAQILAGETKLLWIYEISRGTRDLEVWARLARVCREQGVYVVLDDDVYNPTKSAHMKQLNQLMIDAVYESDRTSERVARDAEEIAEEGRPWGKAAFGYRREYDPHTGDLLRQIPDPEQAEIVQTIARRIEAGESPSTIASDLNREGVPSPGGVAAGQERTSEDGRPYITVGWTHQVVVRVVTRPAVMGKRVHRGQIKPAGGWKPIIEPERWELIRSKVGAAPRGGRPWAITHLLSGLAICDICEGQIRAFEASDRNPTYRCNGRFDGDPRGKAHVQRAKHILEKHVTEALFERFSDPDVLDALWDDGADPGVEEALARMGKLQRELEELYADVGAGQVSRRMAAADEGRIRAAMREVEPQTRRVAPDLMLTRLAEGDPSRVWAGWDLHQRREALRVAAREIRVLKVGPVGRRVVSAEESVWIVWA